MNNIERDAAYKRWPKVGALARLDMPALRRIQAPQPLAPTPLVWLTRRHTSPPPFSTSDDELMLKAVLALGKSSSYGWNARGGVRYVASNLKLDEAFKVNRSRLRFFLPLLFDSYSPFSIRPMPHG